MAFSKIMEGLKEAVRIARCHIRHEESHVCTRISEHRYLCECMQCDREWEEIYEDDVLEVSTERGNRWSPNRSE